MCVCVCKQLVPLYGLIADDGGKEEEDDGGTAGCPEHQQHLIPPGLPRGLHRGRHCKTFTQINDIYLFIIYSTATQSTEFRFTFDCECKSSQAIEPVLFTISPFCLTRPTGRGTWRQSILNLFTL